MTSRENHNRLARESERRRAAKKIANGICPNSGCNKNNTSGFYYCNECREKEVAYQKRLSQKAVKAGLCRRCRKRPPKDGLLTCNECLKYQQAAIARYKAKHSSVT